MIQQLMVNFSAWSDQNVTLRDLRNVVAVAQFRNFTEAARKLNLSQPSLSQQIQKLEGALGTPFFDRSTRPISLTPEGWGFVEHAQAALSHFEQAKRIALDVAAGQAGLLRIGSIASGFVQFVPASIGRFQALYPKVAIEVSDQHSQEQLVALQAGSLDVGFLNPPMIMATGLSTHLLERQSLYAVLCSNDPLALKKSVTLSDLAPRPYITWPEFVRGARTEKVRQIFTAAGLSPRVAQRTENSETMLRLVEAGVGYAILEKPQLSGGWSALTFVPIEGDPAIDFSLCWRSDCRCSITGNFLELLGVTNPPRSLQPPVPLSR
jgi:DNA-binding transcriptional LysR family regulator